MIAKNSCYSSPRFAEIGASQSAAPPKWLEEEEMEEMMHGVNYFIHLLEENLEGGEFHGWLGRSWRYVRVLRPQDGVCVAILTYYHRGRLPITTDESVTLFVQTPFDAKVAEFKDLKNKDQVLKRLLGSSILQGVEPRSEVEEFISTPPKNPDSFPIW